jgi:hypothetical protein
MAPVTVELSDREIRLLTALRSAGTRGLTISAGRKRAGIARLIQAKYVTKRATGEHSGFSYFITDLGRQALASTSSEAQSFVSGGTLFIKRK